MTDRQSSPRRIVVLISGNGSNLQALIDAQARNTFPGNIVAVISNRPGAFGLERAQKVGIDAITLDHKEYDSRESFDQALQAGIDAYRPDLVVLAGFMRILTPEFVRHYQGKMLNIHPSLLPKYQGLHTHKRALEAGDTKHGVTVHFVTEELDGGPNIVQAEVPVLHGDTPETLATRVQLQEHLIYPEAVRWYCEERLTMENNSALLDGQKLPSSGIVISNAES
ncbi:phosphoribosylglycinamide formyltransferase [Hahella ganghwensis]|uniref:phosphoribosylglycinamide formyltransferase n=1 Tax=Hahella ganghwensis TaxID=286420 RepID=UPI00036C7CA7|nr:phosphoribosylglycinamide formyltransferase [Hahella ganghwensis]